MKSYNLMSYNLYTNHGLYHIFAVINNNYTITNNLSYNDEVCTNTLDKLVYKSFAGISISVDLYRCKDSIKKQIEKY